MSPLATECLRVSRNQASPEGLSASGVGDQSHTKTMSYPHRYIAIARASWYPIRLDGNRFVGRYEVGAWPLREAVGGT